MEIENGMFRVEGWPDGVKKGEKKKEFLDPTQKKIAQAEHLALVQATPWADFAVLSAEL